MRNTIFNLSTNCIVNHYLNTVGGRNFIQQLVFNMKEENRLHFDICISMETKLILILNKLTGYNCHSLRQL